MQECSTKHGKLTHYTRDGVLTLCWHTAIPKRTDHKHREAPFCRRCEKAQEHAH